MFIYKTTVIAVVFLCSWQISWSQEVADIKSDDITPEHSIYLALGNEHDVPRSESQEVFDCTDKVFSVVELKDFPAGKHQLSVRWFDPSDTVREHTRYDFNVRNPTTRLWAWLSLSRGFGGGMLQFINPAAGLEDFIGIWKIDVKIDGESVGAGSFEVSC